MKDLGIPLPDDVRRVVDDPARLAALAALEMLDSEPDVDFERLTRLAARIFNSEIALVTLVDSERQWFRARFGVEHMTEMATEGTVCAYTIAQAGDQSLVVLDASRDARFADNPLVTGAPGLRFYAGAPIIVAGQKVGTLCVIGLSPRSHVDQALVEQLADLAQTASALLTLKDEARVRARTAAALIREEWRHALTLEAGKVGSWVWDVRSGEVSCNDTFRRMYELAEAGVVRMRDVLEATHAPDRAVVQSGVDASLSEGKDFNAEIRVGVDGKRWLALRGRVYQRDAEGNALIMMGAGTDVTESKQSAEQTKLLLRELNHRVKNTLAMIQSVARQTIRQNPDPKAFIEAFSGRLRTISDAHVLLADRDWSGVQLYEVIASQLGPNFMSNPDRADVRGEDVALPADQALGLGLILHELTTNAHRHGAWSDDDGVVSIDWTLRREPVRGLALTWKESGGPRVVRPAEYGLGARLIERSLAKVLDSEVELSFPPDGVVANIWMPLPAEQTG